MVEGSEVLMLWNHCAGCRRSCSVDFGLLPKFEHCIWEVAASPLLQSYSRRDLTVTCCSFGWMFVNLPLCGGGSAAPWDPVPPTSLWFHWEEFPWYNKPSCSYYSTSCWIQLMAFKCLQCASRGSKSKIMLLQFPIMTRKMILSWVCCVADTWPCTGSP